MTTGAMSPLRQRMLEDMQLRGLSARTQEAYTRAVWQLAQIITAVPLNSAMKNCANTFSFSPPRRSLPVPPPPLPFVALSSSMSKP
jgi:hypothetical protein